MCFIFCFGHLKIHSNSLYLGHTVNSLSNARKTHLFLCTIHYFSSFPYNPSDRQLPQSFTVTYDSAFQLGICKRSETEGIPYLQSSSAQHSASPGQALQGHAHALLRGQKPGGTYYCVQNPQSLRRESKTWDQTPTLRTGETTWRVWVTVLPDASGISIWNSQTGTLTGPAPQGRPGGHQDVPVLKF